MLLRVNTVNDSYRKRLTRKIRKRENGNERNQCRKKDKA